MIMLLSQSLDSDATLPNQMSFEFNHLSHDCDSFSTRPFTDVVKNDSFSDFDDTNKKVKFNVSSSGNKE